MTCRERLPLVLQPFAYVHAPYAPVTAVPQLVALVLRVQPLVSVSLGVTMLHVPLEHVGVMTARERLPALVQVSEYVQADHAPKVTDPHAAPSGLRAQPAVSVSEVTDELQVPLDVQLNAVTVREREPVAEQASA